MPDLTVWNMHPSQMNGSMALWLFTFPFLQNSWICFSFMKLCTAVTVYSIVIKVNKKWCIFFSWTQNIIMLLLRTILWTWLWQLIIKPGCWNSGTDLISKVPKIGGCFRKIRKGESTQNVWVMMNNKKRWEKDVHCQENISLQSAKWYTVC